MERTQKSLGKYWILFFLSLALMLWLLCISPYGQWFWLVLPIVCTTFVLAMDLL
ncbi:MAG: hypothetical protein ABIX01_00080 [Chitinophagaceae bacterium]